MVDMWELSMLGDHSGTRFYCYIPLYCHVLDSVVEKAPLAVMDMDSFNLEVLIILTLIEGH